MGEDIADDVSGTLLDVHVAGWDGVVQGIGVGESMVGVVEDEGELTVLAGISVSIYLPLEC